MDWTLFYTRTFLKELSRLPESVRDRIEAIVFGFQIKTDPYLDGKCLKLAGYQEYYKIRVASYRIGVRIDANTHSIEFLHVLQRRDIYRRFP